MKANQLTYSHLATRLDVSETTVKRFFTAQDGSVGRLQEICSILSISFSDLVEQSRSQREQVFTLTDEQEHFFVLNPNYFSFFEELLQGHLNLGVIRKKYGITQGSAIKYVKQLEKMDLVEWLPSDRIKLKVAGTHNWRDGGPLQETFLPADNRAFLSHLEQRFQQDDHFMTTSNRRIHPDTLRAVIADLRTLFSSYRKRVYRDEVFYPKGELVPVKWIMGIGIFESPPYGEIVDL